MLVRRSSMLVALYSLASRACKLEEMVCDRLALLHELGTGVSLDLAKAYALYAKACGAGSSGACTSQAMMLEEGRGVAKDEAVAAKLFASNRELNVARACARLSKMYAEGRGVPKDEARATVFQKQACDSGDEASCPPKSQPKGW